VLADELVDRAEAALDPVEIAGVGRGRDELDVVEICPGTDLRGPVAGEAVLDPVEADVGGIGEPDQLHERECRVAVAAWARSDPQVVGVDVEGADQVADPVAAVVGGAVALGPAAPGPAAAVPGAEALRPLL